MSTLASISPIPTPYPSLKPAVDSVTSSNGIDVWGYLALLIGLYLIVPMGIIWSRTHDWDDSEAVVYFLKRVAALDAFKGLMLTNRELTRRPLNQQLEAYLYSRTNYGLVIDVMQAVLSLISCALVLYSASFPFTEPDPDWASEWGGRRGDFLKKPNNVNDFEELTR